jgi:hypothetical protein
MSTSPIVGENTLAKPLTGNPLGPYYQNGMMTYRLCQSCTESNPKLGLSYFHPVHTRILLDSLAATNSPARALQAFWTVVYQSYYYDNLQFFNVFSNSSYVTWSSVLVPTQTRGLALVISFVVAHLVLVYVTLICFHRQTRFSRLHDPWLAYTQAHHGELANALDDSVMRTVKSPEGLLRRQQESDKPVGLDVDILGRAVGIRKRPKRMAVFNMSDDSD